MGRGHVALVRGDDRYTNVAQALQAIADDVELAGKQRIVIKPNFVTTHDATAATHREAVRAVLDLLWARGIRGVTLAEGPAMGTLEQGLRNYGYQELIDKYGLRTVDLNSDEGVPVDLWDRDLRPLRLMAARTLVESDLRISVGPPKTHDYAIVTLSLKNMAVGALLRGQKSRIHQSYPVINLNLYRMARYVAPHLTVIDGFQAMEGDGPVGGDPVDWRIAIASTDFVAADSLAATLMGFPAEGIGYLHYCRLTGLGEGDLQRMRLEGNVAPAQVQRRFRPHRSYKQQVNWQIPDVERYL